MQKSSCSTAGHSNSLEIPPVRVERPREAGDALDLSKCSGSGWTLEQPGVVEVSLSMAGGKSG